MAECDADGTAESSLSSAEPDSFRAPQLPLAEKIGNYDEIVLRIRKALKEKSAGITISFFSETDVTREAGALAEALTEAAFAETDDPAEGDYLRYQVGGYSYKCTSAKTDDGYDVRLRIEPSYYATVSQEEAASEKAEALTASFGFTKDTSDAEKIRIIYDAVCRDARYDKVHVKNEHDHTDATAYAALVRKCATCQGFCTALYRLLKMSGIDCRIVTGQAETDGLHAWVIAEVNGLCYLLDPTRDAGKDEYRYFLLGTAEATQYLPGEDFRTETFLKEYPLAEQTYKGETP